MDLRRIKTVFIIFLLGINIFMGWILWNASVFEQQEKVAMSDNISEILSKEMIILPGDLVLPETPVAKNYYLEKMFGSNAEMIVKFLGQEYEETGDRTYASEQGTLFINGDEFLYRKSAPEGNMDVSATEKIEALCREEMKRLGIMEKAYCFSGVNQIPNAQKAIFTVKHETSDFFDAYVSFDVNNKGITAIGGKNIISDMEVMESANTYPDAEGVLVGLIKSEKLQEGVPHKVISIKHGYYIGKGAESYRNILAIPVWQVAVDNGQILHFDARNGRELEE